MVYDHKEASKKFDRCWDTLGAILVSTITPATPQIPTSKEKLLKTLAEAVIQYIGDRPKKIGMLYNNGRFEKEIHAQLTEELLKHGDKLHPEIRTAIDDLTKPTVVDPDGPEHPYTTCEAYEIFRGRNQGVGPGIRPLMSLGPTFSPAYDWVLQTKKELEELPAEQRKDIEGIGKILREIWQKQ